MDAVPRQAVASPATIIYALISVVVQQGLDAVSIRTVARAAGVSIGTVQYHFATKDDLLLAAYRHAIDEVTARARTLAARPSSPLAYVRSLLHELLPLDDRRRGELHVAIAFTARSVHSPRLTELYADGYRALVGTVTTALHAALADGSLDPSLDPARAATQAVAMADGLAWHLLCAPSVLAPDDAVAALDAHLTALEPAPRRAG